jgi:hypothetical protein
MTLSRRFSGAGRLLLAILPLQVSYARPTVDRQTSTAPSVRAGKSSIATSKPRLYALPSLASTKSPQAEERKPLGALSTVGEVYVNESRAPSESTVFPGDKLRTGESGAATFTIGGRGSLKISPNTRLSFEDDPRYVVTLEQGTVVLSVFGEAAKFEARTGDFVVIAGPEATEAISQIERSADGSSRVLCKTGAVGVIALETAESVFLRPDQFVTISAQGRLQAVNTPSTTTGAPNPASNPAPRIVKKSHTGWIILGVAGGGGAAAAAVLASGHKSSVSPSVP